LRLEQALDKLERCLPLLVPPCRLISAIVCADKKLEIAYVYAAKNRWPAF
jgi:hypothetical protein